MPMCTSRKSGLPKMRFVTYAEALPHATGGMDVYMCDSCGCFHVGHFKRGGRRHKKKSKRFQSKQPHRKNGSWR